MLKGYAVSGRLAINCVDAIGKTSKRTLDFFLNPGDIYFVGFSSHIAENEIAGRS